MEDLSAVKNSEIVIICDISLIEKRLAQTLKLFAEIEKEGALTYIDHHPLPDTISKADIPGRLVHDITSSASELTYTLFQSQLHPDHTRTAIYGAIADYLDHTPLIQQLLKRWDERTLHFETGILFQGIESLQKTDHHSKKRIVTHLANNLPPSLDADLTRLAVQYTRREWDMVSKLNECIRIQGNITYVLNFPFSLGKTATYVRGLTNALVGLAGDTRKDYIDMSLRSCDERIDLNRLLRKIAPTLGGGGGGHPKAAGARIPEKNFSQFLIKLNQSLRQ
jgi:RecJ-like exonuclease